MSIETYYDNYLQHHGIKGQKWGVRRFQNKDGSVTNAGAKRYYDNIQKYSKAYNSASSYSDRADSEYKKAKEMRKKLKLRDVIRNKSKEAKEYSKQYDKAMKMQEAADIKWKEAKESYKATGKNAVSRFLNNMKYDLDKENKQRPFDEHLGSPMEQAKKSNGRIGRAPTLEEIRKKNHSYNI